jgi:acetylglutamate kinase
MSETDSLDDLADRFSRDAGILAQALPYMQRYEGKTVVVKYGGHAMGDARLGQAFARDIALLKQSKVNPIVVHGGGPQIASMLKNLGIESKFEGGCASPTSGRWKSSKWFSPARSTRKSWR